MQEHIREYWSDKIYNSHIDRNTKLLEIQNN